MTDLSGVRLPLRIYEASDECLGILDAIGLSLVYVYYDDGPEARRSIRNRPTKAQALAVARITARAIEAAVKEGRG